MQHAKWLVLLFASAIGACGEDSLAQRLPEFGTHVNDWRDEVIYQIVVDRFDNGDESNDVIDGVGPVPRDLSRHQGGDFAGVMRRLDYLAQLGVTTLWLSPIVENVARTEAGDGYHGYWASDFTRINPRFGTLEELRALVVAAHERDMKVMLDVVINHSGAVFFYDLDGDGELDEMEAEPPHATSGYEAPLVWLMQPPRLWTSSEDGVTPFRLEREDFHLRGRTDNYSDAQQLVFGDFPTGLRDLATSRPKIMSALIDTYVEWVRRTDVDGFRLDAAPHVSHADWAVFCTSVRERLADIGKRNFMLLGEVYRGDPRDLAAFTASGEFDAVFDFTLKYDVIDQLVLEGGSAALARAALEAARSSYPSSPQGNGVDLTPWQARVVFGDNHDMARMRGRLDDERAAVLALALLFTVDGIPAIYYGTEQGMSGEGGHASREVLWKAGFDTENPTFRAIERFARLRRAHPALRYGDLLVRYAGEEPARGDDLAPPDPNVDAGVVQPEPETPDTEEPAADAGLLAYERSYGSDRLLFVLNARPDAASRARVLTGFREGTKLVDLFGSDLTVSVGARGRVEIEVERRSAVLLGPRE